MSLVSSAIIKAGSFPIQPMPYMAIGGSMAGYMTGNNSLGGAIAGGLGAYGTVRALSRAVNYAYPAIKETMMNDIKKGITRGSFATKSLELGRMLTRPGTRGMLFASGALLGGAAFGSLFAGSGKNYDTGFNSRRGNRISR